MIPEHPPNSHLPAPLHLSHYGAMARQARQPKQDASDTDVVNTRLSKAEAEKLNEYANRQSVPVSRGALVAHILREWLKQQEKRER
jgi:hypothetical protein